MELVAGLGILGELGDSSASALGRISKHIRAQAATVKVVVRDLMRQTAAEPCLVFEFRGVRETLSHHFTDASCRQAGTWKRAAALKFFFQNGGWPCASGAALQVGGHQSLLQPAEQSDAVQSNLVRTVEASVLTGRPQRH